jgi:hypothetical protein
MKRGLSNVIASVLIILLALAAVAIVWTLITSLLNTDEIVNAQEEIDLSLVKFSILADSVAIDSQEGGDDSIYFLFRREAGGKEKIGAVIRFSNASGDVKFYRTYRDYEISEFQTLQVAVYDKDSSDENTLIHGLNQIKKIEIFAVKRDLQGTLIIAKQPGATLTINEASRQIFEPRNPPNPPSGEFPDQDIGNSPNNDEENSNTPLKMHRG